VGNTPLGARAAIRTEHIAGTAARTEHIAAAGRAEHIAARAEHIAARATGRAEHIAARAAGRVDDRLGGHCTSARAGRTGRASAGCTARRRRPTRRGATRRDRADVARSYRGTRRSAGSRSFNRLRGR
jgi:hypothetical protein